MTREARVNDYDTFAEAYSAETGDSLVNAYYERPAILALAGDVAGRRILDAGCGAGPLSAALRDRGAVVTGIDASAGMLELARRTLGDEVALQVADLNDRLPFDDGAFDPGAPARLLRDQQLCLRLGVRRADRPDEVLAQAVARDDRCLRHGRLPPFRHQRAVARPGRPGTVPRRVP
ncbi:class I SAM-dependent DNA methyltransferase [Prauserella flavalba]|uniref:class I SAM-dependent DNA methyltransferase n=1 Tax=Prauserella flavalba TaxID=1477506 RepID=UPI003CCC809B